MQLINYGSMADYDVVSEAETIVIICQPFSLHTLYVSVC